jgi:hypothetical protein
MGRIRGKYSHALPQMRCLVCRGGFDPGRGFSIHISKNPRCRARLETAFKALLETQMDVLPDQSALDGVVSKATDSESELDQTPGDDPSLESPNDISDEGMTILEKRFQTQSGSPGSTSATIVEDIFEGEDLPNADPFPELLNEIKPSPLPSPASTNTSRTSSASSSSSSNVRTDFYPLAGKDYGSGLDFFKTLESRDSDRVKYARSLNPYWPFSNHEEWELGLWLIRSRLSQNQINQFLKLKYVSFRR